MSKAIIPARELARRLGVSELRLQELANEHRLPFAFSTAGAGFYIRLSKIWFEGDN